MIAAFANRAIDAAVQVEPTAAVAVNLGLAVKWREAAELSPGVQAAVVVYSPQFAEQPDVARRWMLAYLQGVRAYNDAFKRGIDREGIVAVLAAQLRRQGCRRCTTRWASVTSTPTDGWTRQA